MAMGLVGGLALFLYGMGMMSTALKTMAGSRLKQVMGRLAGNRLSAVATGCVATAVVQSSSITTVIAIGFVSAGIISLSQALGIAMGAAIGTTVTAQIVAFKVTHYALLLIGGGFFASMWRSRPTVARLGTMVMGLGVIFYGLGVMSEHMAPLRSYDPFVQLMASMNNPLLGILLAAAFTALVQSSSATLGVIIALASQGLIPLEAGLALVYGANVGTTITALLATIGQPKSALQSALSYLTFKVIMVAIWLPLIGPLESLTRAISPVAEGLEGAAVLAYEVPRQIANAHTLINLLTVAMVLPFTGAIAWLVLRITGPEAPPLAHSDDDAAPVAVELHAVLLNQPSLAVEATRREVIRLGARVAQTLDDALDVLLSGREEQLQRIHSQDDRIDRHHEAIVAYVEKLLQVEMAATESRETAQLLEAADFLESIGDVVDKDMVPLGQRRLHDGLTVSPQTAVHLRDLKQAVVNELRRGLDAVASRDQDLAQLVVASKPQIRHLEAVLLDHQLRRLQAPEPQRVAVYTIERDLAEALRRIYSLTRRFTRAGSHLRRHPRKTP